MQQQTNTAGSSYYPQYYQNATAADPPPFNPASAAPYASAPPATVSPSDYSHYLSNYPSYLPISDPAPSPPQYSFPHLYDNSQHHQFYHQNQPPENYAYDFPTNENPNPEPKYDSSYSMNSFSYGSSAAPYQANSFESSVNYGGDQGMFDTGVHKYNGGQAEPSYGGKGSRSSDSGTGGGVMFDDYGRPINVPGGKERSGYGNPLPKIVKAVPKAEDSEDVKSGIQKFRVKMLSEGYGQTDVDVLCQIGLDGIRFLDPTTSRTLKIYPLEMVTRWEVLDSYIFAFWAKTSVDPEPRRIRLKSNSYTTNNILDTVTAASIQSKEIGSTSSNPSDLVKGTEQSVEKKKALIDWRNFIKPVNEEKDHWVPDEAVAKCTSCGTDFSAFNRKHHCRNCGDIFCDKCTQGRIALTADEHAQPVRVCDQCMAEVTQRLSNKVAPGRVVGLQSHEDLARKLQEEMHKQRKTGVKPEVSGMTTREVACPTCTVHLQVRVPASGSETIECSVCQHPFLVSAH